MTDTLRREPSFVDLVLWALERFPDRVAVVDGDQEATYRQTYDRMSQFASVLAQRGLSSGDGLMVLAGNRVDALLVGLAARTLGCWSGSLHPLGSLDDQAYIVEDSEAAVLVFDPTLYEERAAQIMERVPAMKLCFSLGPSAVGEDILEKADATEPGSIHSVAECDDICSLTYSGGTTGRPKGVVQRHRTAVAMNELIMTGWQLPQEIRFLALTPISHAASCFVLPTWMNGGTVVLLKGFSAESFYDVVARYRITVTFMVPTILYALLDHPATEDADVSSLETIVYGAAPMAPSRLAEALDVFGPVFVQLYGQSEAPATVTTLRKEEHDLARPELLGSCGRPLPGIEVQLLDDEGREVSVGETGEICVRGRIVSDGYLKLPELTAETFRGSWLHTGDMARRDEAGYLYIVDRKKDMIVSGGFNVFPREIEDVLAEHPAVALSVAVGVPDDHWGEAVKVLVVPRPGQHLDREEVVALVRERKGPVYAPKSVDVVDALPLTGLGKPDRKAIRAQFWHGRDRRVN